MEERQLVCNQRVKQTLNPSVDTRNWFIKKYDTKCWSSSTDGAASLEKRHPLSDTAADSGVTAAGRSKIITW